MKAPITLLALAFTLGLTHPLQCMETPLLSDKLGTLRTNLDTLKKSLSKLKQRLEALKEALKKPSGAGLGGGGPGGGGPGGDGDNGGGTPTSKPLMPFESLPEELNKEIMSFVLESNIKFNFTDSKSLYNSIKAAGRKFSSLRQLSKYYAEQYKMSVVIGIICRLLKEQLEREGKTLDVPRSHGDTILDLAIKEKNVVMSKIVLCVDPKIPLNNSKLVERFRNLIDADEVYFVTIVLQALGEDVDSLVKRWAQGTLNFLNYAVIHNKTRIVQAILNALGDKAFEVLSNVAMYYSKTALDFAIEKQNLDIVQAILNALGNRVNEILDMPDFNDMPGDKYYHNYYKIAFGNAMHTRNKDIVEALLRAAGDHAKKLVEDWRTVLHLMAESPDPEKVQLILNIVGDADEFVRTINSQGMTALAVAIKAKNLPIVKLFLSGNDFSTIQKNRQLVMMIDKKGKTVLHYEHSLDDPEIVTLVLNAAGGQGKKLVTTKDNDGNTILHGLNKQSSLVAVKAVLKAAGDKVKELVMTTNNQGKTPLDLALEISPEIKEVLEQYSK